MVSTGMILVDPINSNNKIQNILWCLREILYCFDWHRGLLIEYQNEPYFSSFNGLKLCTLKKSLLLLQCLDFQRSHNYCGAWFAGDIKNRQKAWMSAINFILTWHGWIWLLENDFKTIYYSGIDTYVFLKNEILSKYIKNFSKWRWWLRQNDTLGKIKSPLYYIIILKGNITIIIIINDYHTLYIFMGL